MRKAREHKGLTQAHVAEATDWSLSKVMRIESGDVGISATDLRALLDLYEVTDEPTREKLVEDAVHGMLPKTKMGEAMYRKLKVYAGPDHPHAAQKPSKREVA